MTDRPDLSRLSKYSPGRKPASQGEWLAACEAFTMTLEVMLQVAQEHGDRAAEEQLWAVIVQFYGQGMWHEFS